MNTKSKLLTAVYTGGVHMDKSKDYLDSTLGMTDDEMTERFQHAVRIATEKAKIMGNPIAKYDSATKRAYLEYPDGRREYEISPTLNPKHIKSEAKLAKKYSREEQIKKEIKRKSLAKLQNKKQEGYKK